MSWLFRLNFIEVIYNMRTFVNVSGAENFVGSLMVVLPMQVPKSKLIIIIMFVNNSFDDVLITTKKRLLAAMHFQIQMMMRMWCIYRRKENGTFVALCFNYCLSQSAGNLFYLGKEKNRKNISEPIPNFFLSFLRLFSSCPNRYLIWFLANFNKWMVAKRKILSKVTWRKPITKLLLWWPILAKLWLI